MAVSQGWSGWAIGWFEGKGKILQIIATASLHVWGTAQKAPKKLPPNAHGHSESETWYHNTATLSSIRQYAAKFTKASLPRLPYQGFLTKAWPVTQPLLAAIHPKPPMAASKRPHQVTPIQ
jgi:hypothetical protein